MTTLLILICLSGLAWYFWDLYQWDVKPIRDARKELEHLEDEIKDW